jgi:lysophospholipase L1-like esterase
MGTFGARLTWIRTEQKTMTRPSSTMKSANRKDFVKTFVPHTVEVTGPNPVRPTTNTASKCSNSLGRQKSAYFFGHGVGHGLLLLVLLSGCVETSNQEDSDAAVYAPPVTHGEISAVNQKRFWDGSRDKILPFGDSITMGLEIPVVYGGGYRNKLRRLLIGARMPVDFVGSKFNGLPEMKDHNHEGNPGKKIHELDAMVDSVMADYQPSLVLLMAGTVDLASGDLNYTDPKEAVGRLSSLIDHVLQECVLECRVMVSTVPFDLINPKGTDEYNSLIPDMVKQKEPSAVFANVGGLLTLKDVVDGVHPNHIGYDKMADAWFEAIKQLK